MRADVEWSVWNVGGRGGIAKWCSRAGYACIGLDASPVSAVALLVERANAEEMRVRSSVRVGECRTCVGQWRLCLCKCRLAAVGVGGGGAHVVRSGVEGGGRPCGESKRVRSAEESESGEKSGDCRYNAHCP